jgi:hypothetical protein
MPFTSVAVGHGWALTPSIADQKITIGATSTVSTTFSTQTVFVRLATDGAATCSIVFGTAPVATTSNLYMGPLSVEYFGVQGGARGAVIANN